MINFEDRITNLLKIDDVNRWNVGIYADEQEEVKPNEEVDSDSDSDSDDTIENPKRCLYLVCRSKNVYFSSYAELEEHKRAVHSPILKLNEPSQPEKKEARKILGRLFESERSTLSNRFNYTISLGTRENVLYLGMSFRESRPFETLIEVMTLKEMDKLVTFKYKEIAKYFNDDENLIYICKFNKKLNRSQSFATETAGLQGANLEDGYFANLVNIKDRSFNLNKHFNESETDMLINQTKAAFYNCEDIEILTVGQLRMRANEALDLIRTRENSDYFSEREIIRLMNISSFTTNLSLLSTENRIICLQLIKESKTGVTLLADFRLEIIKKLSAYKEYKDKYPVSI